MMKQFLYIFIVGILFYLQSCNTVSTEIVSTMNAAEELMIDRPDSALSILENINANQISSRGDRARYALLYTQAKDKNFIDETDVNLISEAKEYYEDSKDIQYKFLSYYYYGRTLCNNGKLPQAIAIFVQAEELIAELNDSYLSGLLYTQIGNLYRQHYDYDKCLKAYRSAYEYYTQSNKNSHAAYALFDIGTAYWSSGNIQLGIEHILSAEDAGRNMEDHYLRRVCYENLIIMYDKLYETTKCGYYVDVLLTQFDITTLSSKCLSSIASYYVQIGNTGKANHFLDRAWLVTQDKTDTLDLYYKSADIMEVLGNEREALRYFKDGIQLQDSILRDVLRQPLETVQKDYFRNQAQFNEYRLEKNTQIYVTLSIIVLLVLLIIAMYIRHHIISKDIEISKYMDMAREFQVSIQTSENRLSEMCRQVSTKEEDHASMVNEMNTQIVELFHKQYELLDKLSNTYYETQGFNKDREYIYAQVKSEIDRFANDKKTILQLERIINTYKHNVIELIRSEMPTITESDIRLLLYIYAGFSAKSISVFIGETISNINTRKFRLRSKISKSNIPSMGIILQEMP